MSENTVYCHACRHSAMFEPESTDVPLCPGCGSDFVELSAQPLPTAIPITFDPRQLLENMPGTLSTFNPKYRVQQPKETPKMMFCCIRQLKM